MQGTLCLTQSKLPMQEFLGQVKIYGRMADALQIAKKPEDHFDAEMASRTSDEVKRYCCTR
eukprot:3246744-Lingulodinium_polyedra.AAC.1